MQCKYCNQLFFFIVVVALLKIKSKSIMVATYAIKRMSKEGLFKLNRILNIKLWLLFMKQRATDICISLDTRYKSRFT